MKNIAIIGSGSWGLNIIKNFVLLNKLGMICDIKKTNFEKIKKEIISVKVDDIRLTTNIKDVIRNKEIKAVVIATPPATHFNIAKRLLLAGKDIWVEKPVVLKAKDAKKIAEISKKKNKIVLAGHILLYHPAYCKLKELIEDGYLGEIKHVISRRCAFGKVRKNENALWSLAVHDIAALIYLLDKKPEDISCLGLNYIQKNVADIIYVNMKFKNNLNVHINSSWLYPYKERELIITGSKACAVVDEMDNETPLKVYNQKVANVPAKALKEEYFPIYKGEVEKFNFDNTNMLKEECLHFIECIENNKQPKSDAKSAWEVIEILEKCELSMKKNAKWEKIR